MFEFLCEPQCLCCRRGPIKRSLHCISQEKTDTTFSCIDCGETFRNNSVPGLFINTSSPDRGLRAFKTGV